MTIVRHTLYRLAGLVCFTLFGHARRVKFLDRMASDDSWLQASRSLALLLSASVPAVSARYPHLTSAAASEQKQSRFGQGLSSIRGGAFSRSKLKPFSPGLPTDVHVDAAMKKLLASGKPWYFSKTSGNAGLGRAVMDIRASPHVIWKQLLDFHHYGKKVPGVRKCHIYKRERYLASERLFVKFESPVVPGITFVFHCNILYEPLKNSMTWTLDFDKKNDLEDIQGHWHVSPISDSGDAMSRVFYETQIMVPKWLPRFLTKLFTKKCVGDASSWIRKHSERAHR